jgi:peptidyl-prolyl cis-trans isomerase A (cyclophilin A)
MKTIFAVILTCLLLPVTPLTAAPSIRIQTSLGVIEAELYPDKAPATVTNFLRYVEAGHYLGGQFHRTVRLQPDNQPQNTVKIEVIQGGINPTITGKDWPPIALERTRDTGLRHLEGTLSMARAGPDTATSDFFVCVGDQPELNFGGNRNPDGQGFAAFGHITRGMDIVRRIHQSPAEGQSLTPPVRIEKIELMP